MNLRHLRVFIVVAETLNMSHAANKLFIAQPSVSQTISELEHHYNIKLFERLTRKLYLTPQGEQLYLYATHILNSFDEMEATLKNISVNHHYKMGATITVGTCIMSNLQNYCKTHHPGLSLSLFVDNTHAIESLILLNKLDLAIVEGTVHSKDIHTEAIIDDQLVLACSPLHPLAHKKKIHLSECLGLAFICREKGSGTREIFESQCLKKGVEINEVWTCNNSEAIKNAIIQNIGVSVISKMLIEKEVIEKQIKMIEISDLDLRRHFSLIYHKNKFISDNMLDLLDTCRHYATLFPRVLEDTL